MVLFCLKDAIVFFALPIHITDVSLFFSEVLQIWAKMKEQQKDYRKAKNERYYLIHTQLRK